MVGAIAAVGAIAVAEGSISWPPRLAEIQLPETGSTATETDATDATATETDAPAEARRRAVRPVSFEPLEAALARFGQTVEPAPSESGVRSARRYLDRREGDVSFAALAPGGDLLGHHPDAAYPSASLSKAMLLAARLRQLGDGGEELDDAARAVLEPMITISDNNAANAVYSTVGDTELEALADDAGMTSFEPTFWADIDLTPADQARFFLRVDRLVPREHRRYALDLLSSIHSEQSWGIPEASEPRLRAFFKGGWRPEGDGWIVHQAARLEDREGNPIAVAVLSRGNPSYEYGQATIEGVTERLLGRG